MTAQVFNIQKFSLHDGPGIRTAVFFKGCNLKCQWCANPESQRQETEVWTDMSLCALCGACTEVCGAEARKIHKGALVLNYEKCTCCLKCKEVCKNSAITLIGKTYAIEEILKEVLKDLVFYQQGGGVTLTGGEIFMQYDAALALCSLLKAENIHIVIETAGFAAKDRFSRLARLCDLIYIDIKHHDNQKHIEGTGAPVLPILKNIRWLSENHPNYVVRIPIIPDYNDSLSDAEAFGRTLNELNVKSVEILPFHAFGSKKYEHLGKEYAYQAYPSLNEADLAAYIKKLEQYGVIVLNDIEQKV